MSKLLSEYKFKGRTLEPFSKARLSLALAAGVRVGGNSVTIKDMFGIIFMCLCDKKTAVLAQIDPVQFWLAEGEWEDKNIDPTQDIAEVSELVKNLLNDALSTQANPITEFDDFSGN
jgi:hypothetical protein